MSGDRNRKKAAAHQGKDGAHSEHPEHEIPATHQAQEKPVGEVQVSSGRYVFFIRKFFLIGSVFILSTWLYEKIILPRYDKTDSFYREKVKEFDNDLIQYEVLEASQLLMVHSLHTDTIPTKEFDYILPLELDYYIATLDLIGTAATSISVGESMAGIDEKIADNNTDNYGKFTASMYKKIDTIKDDALKAFTAHDNQGEADKVLKEVKFRFQDSLKYFKDKRNDIVRKNAKANEGAFNIYALLYLIGSLLITIDILSIGFKEYNKDRLPKIKSPG